MVMGMTCIMAVIVAALLRRRKLRNEVAAVNSNKNRDEEPEEPEPGIVPDPDFIALSALRNLSVQTTLSRGEGVAAANETNDVLIAPEAGSLANIVHQPLNELQVPGNGNIGSKFQYENEEEPKDAKTAGAVHPGDV